MIKKTKIIIAGVLSIVILIVAIIITIVIVNSNKELIDDINTNDYEKLDNTQDTNVENNNEATSEDNTQEPIESENQIQDYNSNNSPNKNNSETNNNNNQTNNNNIINNNTEDNISDSSTDNNQQIIYDENQDENSSEEIIEEKKYYTSWGIETSAPQYSSLEICNQAGEELRLNSKKNDGFYEILGVGCDGVYDSKRSSRKLLGYNVIQVICIEYIYNENGDRIQNNYDCTQKYLN